MRDLICDIINYCCLKPEMGVKIRSKLKTLKNGNQRIFIKDGSRVDFAAF